MLIQLLSLISSIYFNLRYLSFRQARKFPFWIRFGTKVKIEGKLVLQEGCSKPFSIKFGGKGSEHVQSNCSAYLFVAPNASIIFGGTANIGMGTSIRVDKRGTLYIGNNFSTNRNCNISCSYSMRFDDDVLLGWNIWIRDTDGHDIRIADRVSESSKEVVIHKHVWIGSFVHILKGVEIGEGSVVAWGSCVIKPIPDSNVLIGGYPARTLRTNVEWKK